MKAIWFGQHLYRAAAVPGPEYRRDQPRAAEQGRAAVRRGPQGIPRRRRRLLRRQGTLPAAQPEQGPRRRLLRGRQFPPRLHPVAARRRPAARDLRRPQGHPQSRRDRSRRSSFTRPSRRSSSASVMPNVRLALVHRLEHAVAHDADALEYGQGSDERTAHPVSGGR